MLRFSMLLKRQLLEAHLAELHKAEGADAKHRQAHT
jgi:hypothetical protein